MGVRVMRRLAALGLIAALAGSVLPPATAQGSADQPPPVPTERLAGATRFATAAAVSAASFDRSATVYVAPGGAFPYALAGGPRAARDEAPILLVDGERIPEETAAELRRLQPGQIVLLGGTDVIPEATAQALAQYGTVRRVGVPGALGSVAAIARDGWPQGASTVYVATDRDFPDALAGGVAGALADGPVLLTSSRYLPPETAEVLASLDPEQVTLLGGVAAISDGVARQIADVVDARIVRLGGLNRIGTTLEVSSSTHPLGEAVSEVWLATAGNFPDAMASAPAIAAAGGALLLTPQDCLPYLVRDELARLSPDRIVVLGGVAAISEAAADLTTCEELPPPPTFEVVDADPVDELPPLGDSDTRMVVELANDDGETARFVQDEVLVSSQDPAAFGDWLASSDGEVLGTIEGPSSLPDTHIVRLPPPSASFSQAQTDELGRDLQWLNGTATGHYAIPSEVAMGTLVAATEAVADGVTVGLNLVMEPAQLIDAEVQESANIGTVVPSRNPFSWPQFSYTDEPRIGTAEAWRLLVANGRDEPQASIGIIDGGFATSNGDYPPGVVGSGERNGSSCGGNPCPWHGTDVTIAAAGVLGNGFGSVGSAGPVAEDVRLYPATSSIDGTIAAIAALFDGGIPDIVNMSFGASIPAVPAAFLGPLHIVTRAVHEGSDVLLVAAAGNDGLDLNREECFVVCWQRQTTIPCELDGVYCVGGLATGSTGRAPGSNYGLEACGNPVCAVDMFAPYTVVVGENPDNPGDMVRAESGTSFSSPYVAGVFALLKAANPDLRAYEMIELLNRTANPSSHPQVGRVVNAYSAVREALGPGARILVGPNRTPSPFPQDPVPATGFSAAMGSDLGSRGGDGVTPATAPPVRWAMELAGAAPMGAFPWSGQPLVTQDVVVVPVRYNGAPGQLPVEMSLVGFDLATGAARWRVDDIAENCLPVLDRDGSLWAVRGYNQIDQDWRYVLLKIDPDTGEELETFQTPDEDRVDPMRDCDNHPIRTTPDGTRLVVWQGEVMHGDRTTLRLLDITLPDVVETHNLRMAHTVEPGAAARNNPDEGWAKDVRIPADRPTLYLMERDQGDDAADVYDDQWWLHAIDLPSLPRNSSLDDPGVIDRSILLPVGTVEIGGWNVVGDQIIVTGEEFLTGSTRFPEDGAGVVSRTFRIRDTGTSLVEEARQVSPVFGEAPDPGEHTARPLAISQATDTVMFAHDRDGATVGIDRATLNEVWRAPGSSFSLSFHHVNLMVDAAGNGIVSGAAPDLAVGSLTPAGAPRWAVPVRGAAAFHPGLVDFNSYGDFRLAAIAPDGGIIITAQENDLSSVLVARLG